MLYAVCKFVTMEVEPRIAKQYKCHHCCSCKNYQEKGMEGWKKVSLHCCFGLTRRLRLHGKNAFWGILILIARATNYWWLPDTFWLRASKNTFKVGSVNFTNSLSPPSSVKKVRTRSKSSQGIKVMPGKSQGSRQPRLNHPILVIAGLLSVLLK